MADAPPARRESQPQDVRKVASARTIAQLMTTRRESLSNTDTLAIAAIEIPAPALAKARALIERLDGMMQKRAVRAAITTLWSSGQVEGQVCRLKLVNRQMFGRANPDLLQARHIGAT